MNQLKIIRFHIKLNLMETSFESEALINNKRTVIIRLRSVDMEQIDYSS